MPITTTRVYDDSPAAGSRILIDRLWPRGVSKADAAISYWAKELTPSAALRTWFHVNKNDRYADFVKKYQAELADQTVAATELLAEHGPDIVLVTAVKDVERSHVPVLEHFLEAVGS